VSSSDERSESLAAQAAAWVPPWERPQRPPDRAFQAAAEEAARAGDPDDAEERADVDLAAADDLEDDFDGAFEGANPAGYRGDVEDEEPATVDAPADSPDDDPTDVRVGPELPVPDAVEEAVEAPEDEPGIPVDAPLPLDGDDAGDVFDAAADDDVADDDDVDIPITEESGDVDEADADEADDEADADADDEADADTADGGDVAGDGDESGDGASVREDPVARAVVPGPDSGARDFDGAVGHPATRTPEVEVVDLPGLTDDAEFAAALEAILLVVDEPVAEMQLAQILEQPTERVGSVLEDISARYTAAGHGFDLRRAAGGWRLYTRPEYAAYVERFVLDGQSVRLTQAALETLAVVAYKQPVTRSRISAIRGVNCDGVMRTLVTRGLIEECGTEGETGAYLYRTTPLFLEKLGLNSVDQLPPLAPFLPDDVEEVLDASG
jgi:segregation and condensation protein B